jgi:hypothetical protein
MARRITLGNSNGDDYSDGECTESSADCRDDSCAEASSHAYPFVGGPTTGVPAGQGAP